MPKSPTGSSSPETNSTGRSLGILSNPSPFSILRIMVNRSRYAASVNWNPQSGSSSYAFNASGLAHSHLLGRSGVSNFLS